MKIKNKGNKRGLYYSISIVLRPKQEYFGMPSSKFFNSSSGTHNWSGPNSVIQVEYTMPGPRPTKVSVFHFRVYSNSNPTHGTHHVHQGRPGHMPIGLS